MVMKYAKQGTLSRYVNQRNHEKMKEEDIKVVMIQLLLAVDLMHRKQIIHRDIKPDNILLIDKERLMVCISDLGLACKANDSNSIILKCGTPSYVAPEILNG